MKALLAALLVCACNEEPVPPTQFGRLTQFTLFAWSSACDGTVIKEDLCYTEQARIPWTPQCWSSEKQTRLRCTGTRQWELWPGKDGDDWIMAACIVGYNESAALRNASAVFGSVFSGSTADHLVGMALKPEGALEYNVVWLDPDPTGTTLCWRWRAP
jgi:hypothetical protein